MRPARKFLRENKDRPFFLYYPTTVPHLALQVPADSLAEYEGAFPDPPYPGGRGYLPHRTPRAAYAAMVTRLDREIGKLLALVDEFGLRENTIVVFTSDNGPLWERYGGTDSNSSAARAACAAPRAATTRPASACPASCAGPARSRGAR